MKFEKFERIVRRVYADKVKSDKILDSYPNNYSGLLIEEPYVSTHLMQNEYLLEEALDNDSYLTQDVFWFLYEWKPGYSIEIQNKKYVIKSLDDFLEYEKENWKE